MSGKNKNHNSVIFLTTLSVYLGLVLVGATPQVLAQAALTRNFDIKNEIEFKDDLDNKPDDEEIESPAKSDFPALFIRLLKEIQTGVESGKIPLPLQTNFHIGGSGSKTENGESVGFGSDDSLNRHLKSIVETVILEKFQPTAFEPGDANGKWKTVKISLSGDKIDFSLKISFAKSNAAQFAEFLNREFAASASIAENDLNKQAYENTKVTSENNQVFIVTRLPRAAIDEFLAKNAQ